MLHQAHLKALTVHPALVQRVEVVEEQKVHLFQAHLVNLIEQVEMVVPEL